MIARRPFGATGTAVSAVTLGAAGWHRPSDIDAPRPSETEALLRAVSEGGEITVVDTANSYGGGESERRLGAWGVGRLSRRGVVVQTKADRDFSSGDFSRARMMRSLEESCARLEVDHLPFVYLHDPENAPWEVVTAADGALAALVGARDGGLIGHLGLSGGPVSLMERYLATGEFESLITHNRFTLLDRSAERLLDVAAAKGVGVMNAAPYGGGLLLAWPPRTARYAYGVAPAPMLSVLEEFATIARDHDVPLASLALQWSLRDPRVSSTIVGMNRESDYRGTLELASVEIPDDAWDAIAHVRLDPRTWQDSDAPRD